MSSVPASPTRRSLLLGAAGLASAALVGAPTPSHAAPKVVRIGSTAPGHLKFVLFRNRKLLQKEFEKEGIDFDFTTFNGGSEATTALATGAVDVIYTGNNPALRVAASGADVKAIGLSSWVPTVETVVIVRKDSPIKTLADLKGKKVAFLFGTVRHSEFSKALRTASLTAADIEPLNLAFDAAGPALVRGDVDAVAESDATVQKLVEAGEARVLFSGEGQTNWTAPYVISVNGGFARENGDLLRRLLQVDIELARWVDRNAEETIRIFVEETRASEKAVRKTYASGRFFQNPEITDAAVAALKDEERFMVEAKLIKGKVDYDKWIDRSFFAAAIEKVGRG